MIFLPIATTFTTSWFWQKNIFSLLLLRSLHYDYDKKTNYFSFQYYFHYTIIMRIKYYFAITTTFTTPWSRQEINLFSFQHYLHYTIVMRKILQYCFPQEVQVSKRFMYDTVVSPSGTSVESLSIFFLRKFSVFKRFEHDTLVSSSGTSVESYILYYPIFVMKNVHS